MTVPGSLPQRIYLLAHDPAKGRVPLGANLGAMLRAAALAELYHRGHLTDVGGRAAVADRRPTHDPVLDALLDEIAAARPRKWHSWVGRRQRATVTAVRQQLGDGAWARLEPHRFLGLVPTTRVTVRDPRVRKQLLGLLTGTLRHPLGRVDPADAALTAIVAAGDLTSVLDRRSKRDGKRRLRELTTLSGPIGPALCRSIQDSALA